MKLIIANNVIIVLIFFSYNNLDHPKLLI